MAGPGKQRKARWHCASSLGTKGTRCPGTPTQIYTTWPESHQLAFGRWRARMHRTRDLGRTLHQRGPRALLACHGQNKLGHGTEYWGQRGGKHTTSTQEGGVRGEGGGERERRRSRRERKWSTKGNAKQEARGQKKRKEKGKGQPNPSTPPNLHCTQHRSDLRHLAFTWPPSKIQNSFKGGCCAQAGQRKTQDPKNTTTRQASYSLHPAAWSNG